MAAVVVTRGDVDLTEIEQSLAPFGSVGIWDNSVGDDLAVYGRYAALAEVGEDVVFVQDDDVILPPESLQAFAEAYEPGVLTANMPALFRHDFYRDHCLVGFGAIFDRELPRLAFERLFPGMVNPDPADPEWWHYRCTLDSGAVVSIADARTWHRTCDIVFTALTPRKLIDVPYTNLPWCDAPNRMWRQVDHVGERTRMLELVRSVRDA